MNKKIYFLTQCIAVSLIISGCSDQTESLKPTAQPENEITEQRDIGNARVPSVTKYWINLGSTGEYTSTYGGGITFGTSFIHPTTVDASGATDGEPIVEYDFVSFMSPSSTISYSINGAKFVLIQPQFPNAVTMQQVVDYFAALDKYWNDKTGEVQRPTPLGSTSGSGGVIEVKGQVVRDHASPTNASVVTDSYVYKPTITGRGLGVLTKDGYRLLFYGTESETGAIKSVVATNSAGNAVAINSFSLSYALTPDALYYHIVGSLKLADGKTFLLDDYVAGP